MKKNLLLFFLLSVVGVVSSFAEEWTDSNGVTWTYSIITSSDVTGAAISSVANCPTEVIIPESVGEEATPVTWIGRPGNWGYEFYTFLDMNTLTRVTIPEGVRIGYGAFKGCTSLTDIVNLSACISIGGEAFWGCSSLTSIDDMPVCTYIGTHAFYGCSSLNSVGNLPICTCIDAWAFQNCTSLANIGDLPVCTSIAGYAFDGCNSLTSVGNLPTCTRIGSYAFQNCSSLTTVGDLPVCTSIEEYAFYNCSSLTNIGSLSSCVSIGRDAFLDCSSLTSIGDLPVCTTIDSGAFGHCTSLASIGDLSACTSLGYDTFFGCSSLTSIGDLPACTSIGQCAFQNCFSLTKIGDLPVCTSIGQYTFFGCSSLTKIGDLPVCTSIGEWAFSGTFVTSLSIGKNTTLKGANAFTKVTTILVPEESLEAYKSAPNWSEINSRIIPNNVQTGWEVTVTETPETGSAVHNLIGEANLANVIKLKVTGDINSYDIFTMRNMMPNLHFLDLTDASILDCDYKYYGESRTQKNVLGDNFFYNLGNLVDVRIPKNVTSIGINSFEYTNLMTVEIPEGITSIGNGAFSNSGLFDVKLPSTLEYIGNNSFSYCRLKEVVLPDNLKVIDGWAFYFCTSLLGVRLPSSLTLIGDCAFSACHNLRTVKATAIDPNSVTMSDNSFSEYANATLFIPYDEETEWETTREAYKWNTQWGQFGNKAYWKPDYESVSLDDDYDQNKGTIPGVNIGANFGNNAGYHLGQWAQQGFDKMKIKHNGKDGASIIDDDDNLTANELTCDITITANKWYFFCFPFDVDLEKTTAPGECVWRKYNAAVRASEGQGGWQKLGTEEKTLKAGQGYIFQCNTAGTLVISVDNPSFNADNKSPELEENVAANAQDASWNFVGNPFLSYYELEDLGHDAPVTIWNGSGYEAVRPGDDDYALQPFQAFFVQKTAESDKVTVDKDKRETKQQSEKKKEKNKIRRAQQAINPDRLLINLELTDGETTDKTRVVFNDRQQMGYETECDAAKFMSTEQVPQLYTYYNNVKYAINERPNSNTEVRLAFQAPKAGEYTISVTRMDTPMLLKDTELGITFDFQTGSYTFESKAGTNDKRFVLVKNTTATAIQPVTIGDAENAAYFNLAGQKTTANAKGVVISNGKKLLKK